MTVGSGITPESARPTPSAKNVALAGSAIRTRPDAITAGGDFHPALRTCTKDTVASPSKHAQRLPLSRPAVVDEAVQEGLGDYGVGEQGVPVNQGEQGRPNYDFRPADARSADVDSSAEDVPGSGFAR